MGPSDLLSKSTPPVSLPTLLQRLDETYASRLTSSLADPWLMLQTVATAHQRRMLLQALQLGTGMNVLDGGCGYGPVSMELATMADLRVVGLDSDPEKIAIATEIRSELIANNVLRSDSNVELHQGDLCSIDQPDTSFDAAVVRFVLEYLYEPESALRELHRVLRPGAKCCLVDVDDGLSITYPTEIGSMARLSKAFAKMSTAKGVDRHIGRKLAGLLDTAGFEVTNVIVLAQADYGSSAPTDVGRQFLVQRFRNLREDLLSLGDISTDELDAAMEGLANEATPHACCIEGHIAAIGIRRP